MTQHSLKALAVLLLFSGTALAAQNAAMRPGITREVTSGTTDTALLGDLGGQVAWNSGAAGPKVETLMTCGPTVQGLPITIVDAAGTAATAPITVNAASGSTVGGTSGGVSITGNFQGLTFNCDGPSANWVVAGAAPGGGAIVFPNIVSEQACPATITGTGSSTVFTPTCGTSTISITASGQTINVPNNMPGSGGMAGYTLDILYSGNFTPPKFGPGTQWQNKTPPATCGGTTTFGCLSGVTGVHDRLVGQSLDATDILYGPPITNYGAPPTITVGSSGDGSTGCGGTLCSAVSYTIASLPSGSRLVIFASGCGNSSCTSTLKGPAIASVTTSSGSLGSCTQLTGVGNVLLTSGLTIDGVICPITGTGTSATIAVNWASPFMAFGVSAGVVITGATVDDGIGNTASGNSTTPSVAANGTPTSTDILVGYFGYSPGIPFTAGSGWTLILSDISHSSDGSIALQYNLTRTTPSNATIGSATSWGAAIVGLHP